MNNKPERFCPVNQHDWRDWLTKNHKAKQSVWLILHKKNSPTPNLTWSQAVDTALCFGWIDSTKKTLDADRYIQYFGKRNPKSTWSKINKDKVKVLTELGLMTDAGFKSVDIAKQNGAWNLLDSAEKLEIPPDLNIEFDQNPESRKFYNGLSRTTKKGMLQWILMAKRDETRKKRINEIIEAAKVKTKPKRFLP